MNSMLIEEKIKTLDKKWIALGIATLGLGALTGIYFAVSHRAGGPAEPLTTLPPLAAQVETLSTGKIDAMVNATGALASKNTSVLSSKIMGSVDYLGVREGDHVTAGMLLMKINSGEITAQTIQAQAAYNNAKAQYDRIKGLYDDKASTQIEMDQATLGLESAQAGLQAAKAMESYTRITAPISGQVMEKRINLGEMAMPGQPLLRIEDNDHLRLEVTVREQDILHVRPGEKVKVQIDAMPGKDIEGRVSQVVPAADVRTHSFVVKIDVPAEKGLITGMYGKAFFSTGSKQAILVPRSSVVEMAGITGVYLLSADGTARFQMVQLGGAQGDRTEVLTGLASGDRVITDGGLGRIEGRKIIVSEK